MTTGCRSEFWLSDRDEYSWPQQAGATMYEVARSDGPDFVSCTSIETTATAWVDSDLPSPGAAYHYLNRPIAPNQGSWGEDSADAERVFSCP